MGSMPMGASVLRQIIWSPSGAMTWAWMRWAMSFAPSQRVAQWMPMGS